MVPDPAVLPKHRTLPLQRKGSYSDTATIRLLSPPESSLSATGSYSHTKPLRHQATDRNRLLVHPWTVCRPRTSGSEQPWQRTRSSSPYEQIPFLARGTARWCKSHQLFKRLRAVTSYSGRQTRDSQLIHRLGSPMSKAPAPRGPKLTGVAPVLNVRGMDATASPHI